MCVLAKCPTTLWKASRQSDATVLLYLSLDLVRFVIVSDQLSLEEKSRESRGVAGRERAETE